MIVLQNERFYIALDESTELDDIIRYQKALIDIMKIASTAEIYQYAGDSVFHLYSLLDELTLTPGQGEEIGQSAMKRIFREKDDNENQSYA